MTMLNKVREETKNNEEKTALSRALMRMAMQAGDEKAMNIYAEEANKLSNGTNAMTVHKFVQQIFIL